MDKHAMGLNIAYWNRFQDDLEANVENLQLVEWLWRAADHLSVVSGLKVETLLMSEEKVRELLESFDAVELNLEAFIKGKAKPPSGVVILTLEDDEPDTMSFHVYELGVWGSDCWQRAQDYGKSNLSYGESFKTLKQ